MAIEEPSVVAAASSAAKFIGEVGGGFRTKAGDNLMVGQVQMIGMQDETLFLYHLKDLQPLIKERAEFMLEKMRGRGGGLREIRAKKLEPRADGSKMVIVELVVDVCEAMGANKINTLC